MVVITHRLEVLSSAFYCISLLFGQPWWSLWLLLYRFALDGSAPMTVAYIDRVRHWMQVCWFDLFS
jgi:hypothetical protein